MSDDKLIEEIARAIARGCNLDPDAISPKAAKAGHAIPEWFFFADSARAILPILSRERIAAGERVREAAASFVSNARLEWATVQARYAMDEGAFPTIMAAHVDAADTIFSAIRALDVAEIVADG